MLAQSERKNAELLQKLERRNQAKLEWVATQQELEAEIERLREKKQEYKQKCIAQTSSMLKMETKQRWMQQQLSAAEQEVQGLQQLSTESSRAALATTTEYDDRTKRAVDAALAEQRV